MAGDVPPLMEVWERVLLSHGGQTGGCETRGRGYLLDEHPGAAACRDKMQRERELAGIFWFGDGV